MTCRTYLASNFTALHGHALHRNSLTSSLHSWPSFAARAAYWPTRTSNSSLAHVETCGESSPEQNRKCHGAFQLGVQATMLLPRSSIWHPAVTVNRVHDVPLLLVVRLARKNLDCASFSVRQHRKKNSRAEKSNLRSRAERPDGDAPILATARAKDLSLRNRCASQRNDRTKVPEPGWSRDQA